MACRLIAISVAPLYLFDMLQRTLPAGFIAPCLPTKTDKLPSGSQWLHEIKHDGLRTTMSFYSERFLPLLIDLSMRNKRLHPYRERTAGAAEGRVLDIGIGSGLNLPFYAQKAAEIFGLDPSLPLLARAQSKASSRGARRNRGLRVGRTVSIRSGSDFQAAVA